MTDFTRHDKLGLSVLDTGDRQPNDIISLINIESVLPVLVENIENVTLNINTGIISKEDGLLYSKSIDRVIHYIVEYQLEKIGFNIINKYDSNTIKNRDYNNFLHTELHKVTKLGEFYFNKYYWEKFVEISNVCNGYYNIMLDTILEDRSGNLTIIVRRV